jgi:acyl-CoA synthetase (NDP forming)
VALALPDAAAVRASVEDMSSRLGLDVTGFAVQRMVADGVEMLVGAVTDPLFGPVVVCGSGGVLAELLADSATRLHPLTLNDASEMVDELRGVRLLGGYRGAPPADRAALQQTILRISALLSLCPEIEELDINPLKVRAAGVCAVDSRIRVEPVRAPPATRRIQY